jgi:cytochrome c-type biogenesis protein
MAFATLTAQVKPGQRRLHAVIGGTLWMALAVVLALAWLAFPYLMNGRRILGDVGFSIQAERMNRSTAMARLLIRPADGPGDADVDALFATTEYLDLMDPQGAARKYQPGQYLIFFVTETTHVDALPSELPRAILLIDGRAIAPSDSKGPTAVQHHRSSVIRFPLIDAAGQPLLTGPATTLELRLESAWDNGRHSVRTASWDWPIAYPPGASIQGLWSLALVMSLSAGLLSAVLTPCLLQLVVVYFAMMAGTSIASAPGRVGHRRVIILAAAFVAAFTALYTAAGALIGYVGHQSQMFFATINRPAAIVSGTVIILLALWTAHSSRVPVVCRIPMPGLINRADHGGIARAALTAAAFSVGCMTCFGGAIVGTLLTYVGSLGSATVGAAIMLTFSAGVAIPFLAAAFAVSRAAGLASGLDRFRPWAGFVASAVMAAFGIVLITDNFHVLSDFIYPFLHLPMQR